MTKVAKVLGPLLLLGALAWWIWFLSTQPLQDADSWSSVIAGLAALLGLATSLLGHRRRTPSHQQRTFESQSVTRTGQVHLGDRGLPPGERPDTEERKATMKGDNHGIVDLGDHHRP